MQARRLTRFVPLLIIAGGFAAFFMTGANKYVSLDWLRENYAALKAFVVMNARAFDRPRTTRLLQDYVKRTLMPHQYPRIVQFLPELPKTGTGKIDRQALCGMDTGTCDAKTWDASTCDTNTWDAKIRTSVRTDSRQGDAAAAKKARSNRHETERGIETARAAAGRR